MGNTRIPGLSGIAVLSCERLENFHPIIPAYKVPEQGCIMYYIWQIITPKYYNLCQLGNGISYWNIVWFTEEVNECFSLGAFKNILVKHVWEFK